METKKCQTFWTRPNITFTVENTLSGLCINHVSADLKSKSVNHTTLSMSKKILSRRAVFIQRNHFASIFGTLFSRIHNMGEVSILVTISDLKDCYTKSLMKFQSNKRKKNVFSAISTSCIISCSFLTLLILLKTLCIHNTFKHMHLYAQVTNG